MHFCLDEGMTVNVAVVILKDTLYRQAPLSLSISTSSNAFTLLDRLQGSTSRSTHGRWPASKGLVMTRQMHRPFAPLIGSHLGF